MRQAEDCPAFHRSKGGKSRAFKLLPMGSTADSDASRCELCRQKSNSEDPLYAGYEREWAYYRADGKGSGQVCFYSALAHRTRYKSWSRPELTDQLKASEEAYTEFMSIESLVISQKKSGALELDMGSLPVPQVVVKVTREQKVTISAPKEQILTDTAFKSRYGVSFKQAGVKTQSFEVEDGSWVEGVVEVVGEAGVYDLSRAFTTGAAKETVIDDGRPQIDSGQAQANFAHVNKKSKAPGGGDHFHSAAPNSESWQDISLRWAWSH